MCTIPIQHSIAWVPARIGILPLSEALCSSAELRPGNGRRARKTHLQNGHHYVNPYFLQSSSQFVWRYTKAMKPYTEAVKAQSFFSVLIHAGSATDSLYSNSISVKFGLRGRRIGGRGCFCIHKSPTVMMRL